MAGVPGQPTDRFKPKVAVDEQEEPREIIIAPDPQSVWADPLAIVEKEDSDDEDQREQRRDRQLP